MPHVDAGCRGGVSTALLQRIFVRAGVGERNASLATLALVLSPIYMQLSVTFMTDVNGVLALLLCLYGCLRALQAASDNAAIAWLSFAVATNAIVGSARQLGWLGVLVMLPCTLWLLRRNRRVLVAGGVFTVAGYAFIAWCMHWSKHQPYFLGEPIFAKIHGLHDVGKMVRELARAALELPFLLTALCWSRFCRSCVAEDADSGFSSRRLDCSTPRSRSGSRRATVPGRSWSRC